MSNIIEKQVLDLGTLPTKGVDYWTPEEEAQMEAAKNGANNAAQDARTAKNNADTATTNANDAASEARAAAASVNEAKTAATEAAIHANNSATNADRASADANREMTLYTQQENARQAEEQTRKLNENERKASENTRQQNEASRQQGEQNRTNVFVQTQAQRQQTFEASEQARATEFARTEKARQDEFDSKEAVRDAANAEAVRFAGNMADVNRDMGKYQQLPDVTLTLVESGKRIDKDGKFVSDTSWNIGRLGAVSKGNIYELLMGGSDKMVLGTALFVSHTVERIGGQDKDVYKPIYSAVNVDLPISTYAVLLAGEDYSDVLVSYRNDVACANTMKVARWGIFASIATQLANLRGDVDLKSFSDGYYDNMGVGFAKNLIGDGEATAEEFTERVAGGSHQIDDALAEYVTIKGNSVVKNNIAKEVINAGKIYSFSNVTKKINVISIPTSFNEYAYTLFNLIAGHYYFIKVTSNTDKIRLGNYYSAGLNINANNGIIYSYSSDLNIVLGYRNDIEIGEYDISIVVVDLTKWYNGNVPEGLTAEQFIAMNPDVLTMPYTEPHIVNMTAEGVKTTGRNLWDEEWEKGGYEYSNDSKINSKINSNFSIRNKNPIKVFPNTQYYIQHLYSALWCFAYDVNGNILKWDNGNNLIQVGTNPITTPNNCYYLNFYNGYGGSPVITYQNNICINISDPSFNGQYEPHITSERKWAETMKKCFPDGMAKAGNVYDEFGTTKAVNRFGKVDLGSLEWSLIDGLFQAKHPDFKFGEMNYERYYPVLIAIYKDSGLIAIDNNASNMQEGECGLYTSGANTYVRIKDSTYTDAAQFKTAMQGVLLYYELAEPIVTTYDELNLTSRVWRNGMESIIVPEGKESAPISADVIYQINAFKTIKANKQGIEDLNAKPAISLTADEVAKLRALINTNTQNLEE